MTKKESEGKMEEYRDWTQEETFEMYKVLDNIPEYSDLAPINEHKNNGISITASHRNNGRVMITVKDAKYGNVASHTFDEPATSDKATRWISLLKNKISYQGDKSHKWDEMEAALERE